MTTKSLPRWVEGSLQKPNIDWHHSPFMSRMPTVENEDGLVGDMNYIELFAGCGGMTLGLEASGFKLTLANELSPMAAETFAYNFFKENLEDLAENKKKPKKTFWLSSCFNDLKKRLREDPRNYPALGASGFSDLPDQREQLKGSLIIGDITKLNELLNQDRYLKQQLQKSFNKGSLDLVAGGPPCQSFSLAGLRKKDCDRNILPWEFAKFVKHTQPKIALLENVTGILRAFKIDGEKYYAWYEVAKAFAEIGYIPLCLHVNARYVGVPQNRPRFILIGFRKDIFVDLESAGFNEAEEKLFKASKEFAATISQGHTTEYGDLPYFDVTRTDHHNLFADSFLASLVNDEEVSVRDALDDLRLDSEIKASSYVKSLNSTFKFLPRTAAKEKNHETRQNSLQVRRRFRIYQVLRDCSNVVAKEVLACLKQQQFGLSDQAWQALRSEAFLMDDGTLQSFKTKEQLQSYLFDHPTKKQTQRALVANEPAGAALSIPDDACHYEELRTLTVREMARIQSFPDAFEFRSKVTTGGQMRKFEVPQYTQVGNAVPPLLAKALGVAISSLLNRIDLNTRNEKIIEKADSKQNSKLAFQK